MVFSGFAMAESDITLSDFTKINTDTTYTVSGTAPAGWTLSMTLDAAVLRPYMEKETILYSDENTNVPEGGLVSGNADSGLQVVDVTLDNTAASRVGIDTNFGGSWASSQAMTGKISSSGLYGSWNGGGNGAAVGNYAMGSPDFASLNWNNIGSIAVTLSYKYEHADGNGSNMAVAIFDKQGQQIGTTTYGSSTGLRTSASLASIEFSDAVTSAYLYTERLSEADIKAVTSELGKMAAIPEPTTATLSLLALAGLAARRRRR